MSLPILRQNISRLTRFSFSCKKCLSCCRGKKIQINPYEIVRLAHNLRISTTRFIERYTTSGGTLLKWDSKGICVFIDEHGCSVHPDRPLVCRLYPLGRHIRRIGEEHFSEIVPDPLCRGTYGREGIVDEYLRSQGTEPFLDAADRYLLLFLKMYLTLKGMEGATKDQRAIDEVLRKSSGEAMHGYLRQLDVDSTVEEWCGEKGIPFPEDVEEKIRIHIMTLESWVNTL